MYLQINFFRALLLKLSKKKSKKHHNKLENIEIILFDGFVISVKGFWISSVGMYR
ncbi:hypothetical protein GCM10023331_33070 [Algivirga pacifica]|uniref:Uncharacterized protein n=1 Tax=Algivirga pacifica TaxID=1162670 RepID=A0ABP9DHV0_9BACT